MNAPKQLVIVRHGSYTPRDDKLGANGTKDMTSLARHIALGVKTTSVKLLSSPVTYAKQSSRIIARTLGLSTRDVTDVKGLYASSQDECDLCSIVEAISRAAADSEIVIVVTHYHCVETIFTWFLSEFLGKIVEKEDLPRLSMAEAVSITLSGGRIGRIEK